MDLNLGAKQAFVATAIAGAAVGAQAQQSTTAAWGVLNFSSSPLFVINTDLADDFDPSYYDLVPGTNSVTATVVSTDGAIDKNTAFLPGGSDLRGNVSANARVGSVGQSLSETSGTSQILSTFASSVAANVNGAAGYANAASATAAGYDGTGLFLGNGDPYGGYYSSFVVNSHTTMTVKINSGAHHDSTCDAASQASLSCNSFSYNITSFTVSPDSFYDGALMVDGQPFGGDSVGFYYAYNPLGGYEMSRGGEVIVLGNNNTGLQSELIFTAQDTPLHVHFGMISSATNLISLSATGTSGDVNYLTGIPAVPEPGTFGVMALGLLAVGGSVFAKQRKDGIESTLSI